MKKLLDLFKLNIAFLVFILVAGRSTLAQVQYRSDEENFNYSTQLTLQKKYLESAKILRALIIKDPQRSIYWFNFANNLFMLKRFSSALKYYDRVIFLNTKFVNPAKLYKVKALAAQGRLDFAIETARQFKNENQNNKYFEIFENEIQRLLYAQQQIRTAVDKYRQDDFSSAAIIFSEMEEGTNSTDGILLFGLTLSKMKMLPQCSKLMAAARRQLIFDSEQMEYLNSIAERCKIQSKLLADILVNIEAAAGYSDNIFVEGDSIEKVSSGIFKLSAAAEYPVIKEGKLNLGYLLEIERPLAASELNTMTHSLSVFNKTPLNSSQTFDTRISFELQNWNSANELQSMRFDSNLNITDQEMNYGVSIFYDTKSALSGTYEFLSGSELGINPFISISNRESLAKFSLSYTQDSVGDVIYADGSTLPLAHTGTGAVIYFDRTLKKDHLIGGQLRIEKRNYKNAESLSGEKRIDQELGLSVFWGMNLLPSLKINATIESTANTSTLGAGEVRDKNYKVNTLFLNLTWDAM